MSENLNPNYSHLHKAFAETEHGQYLSGQIRWDRYRPKDVSPQRWRELLGVDINNLGHMSLSGNMSRVFIKEMDRSRPGYFTDEDKVVLEVASYVHDWPEAITGDKNYHLKSADDDEAEKAIFKQHLRNFYPGCPPEMEIIINRIIEEVIYAHDNEGLARAFNIIERVGYIRTASRAAKNVLERTAPDCDYEMRQLIGDTFSSHIIPLIKSTSEFPPVEKYLRGQDELISAGFSVVDEEARQSLQSDEIRLKFKVAKLAWIYWSET